MKRALKQKHLVLLGGGHAHIQAIKALNHASRPSWLSVTLIDVQSSASYSGMVPGCVAKFYSPKETLLQLAPLAEWAKTRFVREEVVDIRLDEKTVLLGSGGKISFDCISVDIGSTTRGIEETPGAFEHTIPTRPISKLVERIDAAERELLLAGTNKSSSSSGNNSRPPHVVVIGGGAAGIELSLGIMGRWKPLFPDIQLTLLNGGTELLPNESVLCRRAVRNVLKDRGIQIRNNTTVTEITKDRIAFIEKDGKTGEGEINDCTHCVWATGAGAHPLVAEKLQPQGLDVTKEGWIKVHPTFQSTSHPFLFAAGDCSSIQNLPEGRHSPPKAGVYAVRAGPVLIENLPRYCSDLAYHQEQSHDNNNHNNKDNGAATRAETLQNYEPQSDFLKLLICGDGKALGFRFGIPIYGKWVWELKDAIDRGFMDLFRRENLPELVVGGSSDANSQQYDSVWNGKTTVRELEPSEAAAYLLRTDDNVDHEQAWYTLRRMTANETYRSNVMEHIKDQPIAIAEEEQ